MRLIHSTTLKLHEFVGNQTPPYAILSHTWSEEEVSLQELQSNSAEAIEKKGFDKIRQCCRIAANDGFEYTWIDTCCIDKTSSAELSEAINSMFRWYQRAVVCYAFLADVPSDEDPQMEGSAFRNSRWFTRGWTLQELIAPAHIVFLGHDWEEIGSKLSLLKLVSEVTNIKPGALDGSLALDYWSVAQKMSWAANRVTTREEDTAYCLMGIFNINMPMLYGEGEKAFLRLQEEIIKSSQDESIFAWWNDRRLFDISQYNRGLLALRPSQFASSGDVQTIRSPPESMQTITLVCNFIELRLLVVDIVGETRRKSLWDGDTGATYEPGTLLAVLGCFDGTPWSRLALCVAKDEKEGTYHRIETDLRRYVSSETAGIETGRRICLRKSQMHGSIPRYCKRGSFAFWITVADPQKRPLDIEPFDTGTYTEYVTPDDILQSRRTVQVLGFKLYWTTGLVYHVMIKLVEGKTENDIMEAIEVISINGSDLIGFNEVLSFRHERNDRVILNVPSLGVLYVKLKKLGRNWSPVPWTQGGFSYSKIKLYCLHWGLKIQETVKGSSLEQLADRRYLIEVVLK